MAIAPERQCGQPSQWQGNSDLRLQSRSHHTMRFRVSCCLTVEVLDATSRNVCLVFAQLRCASPVWLTKCGLSCVVRCKQVVALEPTYMLFEYSCQLSLRKQSCWSDTSCCPPYRVATDRPHVSLVKYMLGWGLGVPGYISRLSLVWERERERWERESNSPPQRYHQLSAGGWTFWSVLVWWGHCLALVMSACTAGALIILSGWNYTPCEWVGPLVSACAQPVSH